MHEQARRSSPAESSSFSYGPTVRLRLLSTSPHGDAVTLGYGVVASSDTDFHRADVAPSRAHSYPRKREYIDPSFVLALRFRISSTFKPSALPCVKVFAARANF